MLVLAVATLATGCSEGPDEPTRTGGAVMDVSRPGGPFATVYSDTLPTCPECAIRLHPQATLGSLSDSILLRGEGIRAVRDGAGRTYATVYRSAGHEILAYGSDGTIARTIGRTGDGPGEFRSVVDLHMGAGDTLYVLDSMDRIHVFDSSGVALRTVRLDPSGFNLASLVEASGDGFVLNAEFRSPGFRDHPFHRYAGDGAHVEGFGPRGDVPTVLEEEHDLTLALMLRRLAHPDAASGLLWSSELTGVGYRLEGLDENGRVQRLIGLEADGWRGMGRLLLTRDDVSAKYREAPPGSSVSPHREVPDGPFTASTPAPARLTGIHALGDDLLLVLILVAGRGWHEVLREYDTETFPDEPRLIVHPHPLRWGTVLDVIDVGSGELIARTEVDGHLSIMNDGTLVRRHVSQTGLISLEVLDPEIDLTPRPRHAP